MKILHVVGARPNFMKCAPVWSALAEMELYEQILVHTGQHYDVSMSDVFFVDLGLPAPDHNLGVGSGTHAQQTASIMVEFEKVVAHMDPDLVLVYGDVNSTIAAALVCAKLLIPLGHVEAGLRSFDRTMPEEINRQLTDQIADLLFTPSQDGDENLLREGITQEKIHRVGNVMIDSLVRLKPFSEKSDIKEKLGINQDQYAVLTLHRPSNVDDDQNLKKLISVFGELSLKIPIIFPVHPRARNRIIEYINYMEKHDMRLIDPLGYLDFLKIMSSSRIVLTDSGGIQEETTFLGIPCITLRENTERPITVKLGTNTLVGQDLNFLRARFNAILYGDSAWDKRPAGGIPLWDGFAAKRISEIIRNQL